MSDSLDLAEDPLWRSARGQAAAWQLGVELFRFAQELPGVSDALAALMESFHNSMRPEELPTTDGLDSPHFELRKAAAEGYAYAMMLEAAEQHYDSQADDNRGPIGTVSSPPV